MLFNSVEFLFFFILVFALYWLIGQKNYRIQNILLLVASYFFYGWWDYRFLFLLLFSTALDFFSGLKINAASTSRSRKIWLIASVGINLGFLFFFKYYNFFIDSFSEGLIRLGFSPSIHLLSIVLPVGISFYTFHGLSYVFDIYNRRTLPTENFIDYSVFVSFFPLLVAGPIERATHLLPQVQSARKFESSKAVSGLKQILWGLFKKVVIADNCAKYADVIFNNYQDYHGSTLALGAFFFAVQIYGDFSGYSDIALGTARLLGFDLIQNFNFPYFSRDIAEFWRRWHISLSSWFRDYIYIPLGGSRVSTLKKIRNTFIIFIVSGLWHGANWTFIAWGIINACYFLPLLLRQKNRDHIEIVALGKLFPSVGDFFRIAGTFFLTVLAWIFFRSSSINEALDFIKRMVSFRFFTYPVKIDKAGFFMEVTLLLILFFFVLEWIGRAHSFAIEKTFASSSRIVRWSFYFSIIFLIGMFMQTSETPFIYFQF